MLKDKRLKTIADRIVKRAVVLGYDKKEINDCYVEELVENTEENDLKKLIELCYYKGNIKGLQFADNLIITDEKQSENELKKLQEENYNLKSKLKELIEIINESTPPQDTGKVLLDGRNFRKFKSQYGKLVKATQEIKEDLNEELSK